MEPSGQPEKALLMNLTKVSIHNIVGITEMEFSVKGKLTEISGENATGKTSILSAIQAAAGTGNFAHLIRQGAEKGDVVLEFDTGHVLTAKFGKTKTDRTVTIDGAKMMKVQEWLKARLNPMSFNPVSFMIADAPRRNEMILAITPLSLAFDDLLNAVGNRWVEGIDRGAGFGFEDPLSLLDSIKTKIFDNRTGLNRSIRDKDGQIAELKKTLPPETDEPIDPDGIEVKLKAMRETYKGRLENLEANFQNMKLSQEVTTRRLELLEAERHEKELKSIAAESRRQLELAQCEKDQSLRVLDEEFRAPLEALRERQGAVKARKGELDRSEATKNLIVRVEEERARHNDEAIDNSTALDKLQALRQKLLEVMPVEGLTIENGVLAYGGIPYDTLNEQKKADVAMQIAAAGAGELKIICMDGLEKLSKKSRAHFIKWAAKTDCQFFYCLVKDDEPLTVTSQDPETLPTTDDW